MYCATISLSLWYVGVEHRDEQRRQKWRSCGFVPMDRERWKTNAGSWTRDPRSRVTSCGDWYLGHHRRKNVWSGSCCRRGHRPLGRLFRTWGHIYDTLLMAVWWLSLKTRRYGSGGFHRVWASKLDDTVPAGIGGTCGVIAKGASRRSNFVWSVWPSNAYFKSWSILAPVKWDELYVSSGSLY